MSRKRNPGHGHRFLVQRPSHHAISFAAQAHFSRNPDVLQRCSATVGIQHTESELVGSLDHRQVMKDRDHCCSTATYRGRFLQCRTITHNNPVCKALYIWRRQCLKYNLRTNARRITNGYRYPWRRRTDVHLDLSRRLKNSAQRRSASWSPKLPDLLATGKP